MNPDPAPERGLSANLRSLRRPGIPCRFAFLWPVLMALAWPAMALEIQFAPTGYQVPPAVVAAIRVELGRLIQRHATVFHRPAPAQFDITYHVFKTRDEYEAYARSLGYSRELAQTTGFCHSTNRTSSSGAIISAGAQIITWQQSQIQQLQSTLLHETTHAVTHAFLRRAPVWFLEGSAEWFEQPAWADSAFQRNQASHHWLSVERLLEQNQMPGLRRFLEVQEARQWTSMFQGQLGPGYDVSYTLFAFFVGHPASSTFLAESLSSREIEQSRDPALAFADALERRWPGGLAQFESGWRQRVRYASRLVGASPAARSVPSMPTAGGASRSPRPSR